MKTSMYVTMEKNETCKSQFETKLSEANNIKDHFYE